jgi:hypothetical protein
MRGPGEEAYRSGLMVGHDRAERSPANCVKVNDRAEVLPNA